MSFSTQKRVRKSAKRGKRGIVEKLLVDGENTKKPVNSCVQAGVMFLIAMD